MFDEKQPIGPSIIILVIIIIFSCSLYLNYRNKNTKYPPDEFEVVTKLDNDVVVTGSMVISILDKYKDSGMEFCVITKESETLYGTLRNFNEATFCTYDKNTSEASPEYIAPTGSFEVKIEKENDKIIAITFAQRQ